MASIADESPLEKLLEPLVSQCFTAEVAQHVAAYRADQATQRRIDELAEKCNEGELTDAERAEYEGYVRAINLVSILQAKARNLLASQSNA
jgi:hypothetical protein